jgi:DNA/RNA endonuclease YhcR with UshA esterase domain
MPCKHSVSRGLTLVVLGLFSATSTYAADSATRSATLEQPLATGIAPDEALSHVGQHVTVEFVVKGGRKLDDKEICFLNSRQDYRQPGTFTAVILRDGLARFAAEGVANPGEAFLGKTIRVTGTVEDRNGQAQIVVESPTQIEVIEGADPVSPDAQDR